MRKVALVYFPYPPFPVQSGGQWRCASMILAMIDCGYEVTVVTQGSPDASADEDAKRHGVKAILYPFKPSLSLGMKVIRKASRKIPFLNQIFDVPENQTIQQLLDKVNASFGNVDLLFINYADNKWVKNFLSGQVTLLDTHDLISVCHRLTNFTLDGIIRDGQKIHQVSSGFLDLDYFKDQCLHPTDAEVEGCLGYDAVLMIAEKEMNTLSSRTNDLRLEMVPPSSILKKRVGNYSGLPLFASGPNPFNIQGLMSFQEKVLPMILASHSQFKLNVTGKFILEMAFHESVTYLGVVPDLNVIYQEAGFAVVPTFGGTGQQMKVVEAMGAGLPVVAYEQRVDHGIIEDGVDGFLAKDEVDFAEKVLLLWNDVTLREKMGKAAQEKFVANFSQQVTNRRFRQILESLH